MKDKPIKVIFLPQAETFIDKLDNKSRQKLFFAIRKTKSGLKGQWFKKLSDSDGIFEFRFDENKKFHRLFAFWDTDEKTETLIIGTHGIEKKTNKTPQKEIKKAEKIKKTYFENKKQELD